MPSLPIGQAPPVNGSLPADLRGDSTKARFGVYLHVPFCAHRCGYCDFNTYTPSELGGGLQFQEYAEAVVAEVALARRVMGDIAPPLSTIFVGGGTPTMLPPLVLGRLVDSVLEAFPSEPELEVTLEANPETVDLSILRTLRNVGFNRISLGMQSAQPHVLALLDRQHTPSRAPLAALQAREAGFEHVNLDLIYGTPGESAADWQTSLEAVVAAEVDHVSAYSLIVEAGTALHRRVRQGAIAAPDDDVCAERYLQAEGVLTAAGLQWYEVSNWARNDQARCRHNELYWRSDWWWGLGPGAHSHVGGVRWWNVKHPSRYRELLEEGKSPAAGREVVSDDDVYLETVMLQLRTRAGLAREDVKKIGVIERCISDGLIETEPWQGAGRAVLTLRGRLLADAIVRELV